MGIQGLLPLLKSIHKPCSLKIFSGQTLGVDAYGWLHRGTIACAIDLAQGKPTTKWVDFFMHRVRMLQHFGITPYLVFDGDYLPSKSGTEKDRAARRRESKIKGLELLRLGKMAQAQQELQKSIDVTPEMARQLIDELKTLGIQYVVAPYEADSQLAYLEREGHIDAIISEDSDLLVFGAKCLLTKLDQYGECIMINRDDFTACTDISLVGWTDADFRLMAILNGCDYLPGMDKMGLKTAHRLIRKHKTLDRIIRSVQFEGKIKVPPGYLEAFAAAEATFLYQWVYCPKARCLLNFTNPSSDLDLAQYPCIGQIVEPAIAVAVAAGDLHPHTKQPLDSPKLLRNAPQPRIRNRPQVQTPELKKHKSIDSFFKPQRTPLAELDPNSFTPSPSQQRLLERTPVSWSAEPVRRPSQLSSVISAADVPQRPQRSLTDLPKATATSPKRQRLCSDGFYASPLSNSDRVVTGTSKFFKTPRIDNLAEPPEKTTKDEYGLWSDDSVEQAMSQLPEIEQTLNSARPLKKNRKLSIFNDNDTPDKNQGVRSATEQTPFSAGLATEMKSLLNRFSYSGSEQDRRPSDESTADTATLSSPSKEPKRKRSEADDQHVVPCSSPVHAYKVTNTPLSKPSRSLDATPDINEADWLAADPKPLSGESGQNTQSSAESKPFFSQGSEDFLVPDSEGEEGTDEEAEYGKSQRSSFSLNLAKFAFVA